MHNNLLKEGHRPLAMPNARKIDEPHAPAFLANNTLSLLVCHAAILAHNILPVSCSTASTPSPKATGVVILVTGGAICDVGVSSVTCSPLCTCPVWEQKQLVSYLMTHVGNMQYCWCHSHTHSHACPAQRSPGVQKLATEHT